MSDGNSMREMTGAVRLGLFASDAVRALERTIASKSVADSDRTVLQRSLHLLEGVRDPSGYRRRGSGPDHLALGGTRLDVLTAIESEAPGTAVENFLAPLAAGLEKVLSGESDDECFEDLEVLLKVFVAIGDAEVEHVSSLAQPRSHSIPLWSPAATFRS